MFNKITTSIAEILGLKDGETELVLPNDPTGSNRNSTLMRAELNWSKRPREKIEFRLTGNKLILHRRFTDLYIDKRINGYILEPSSCTKL